jgi:hypothetical protein
VVESTAAGATVKSSAYTPRDSAASPSSDAKSAAATAAVAALEKPHSVATGGGAVPRVVSSAMVCTMRSAMKLL